MACDVVVENFKPGTMARLGLDAATLQGMKPALVYASISGFGQNQPTLAGYDQIAQGTSGMMSVNATPDGPPTKVGVPIGDITAGMFASQAILAALVERATTGRGRYIDVALNDSLLALFTYQAGRFFAHWRGPDPGGQPPRDHRALRHVRRQRRFHQRGGGERCPVRSLLRGDPRARARHRPEVREQRAAAGGAGCSWSARSTPTSAKAHAASGWRGSSSSASPPVRSSTSRRRSPARSRPSARCARQSSTRRPARSTRSERRGRSTGNPARSECRRRSWGSTPRRLLRELLDRDAGDLDG